MKELITKQLNLRYGFFTVIIVLTALFQHTPSFRLELFGLAPMLLVPLTVAISMQSKSNAALLFGAFAGLLWDFASSGADGMYTLMLTTIGFGVSLLVTLYIRNNIFSALIISFISCFAVSFAYWLVFIFRKGYEGMYGVLFTYYIPCAFYTSVFVLLYYLIISYVVKGTKTEKTYMK